MVSAAIYFGRFYETQQHIQDRPFPFSRNVGQMLYKCKYCLDMLGLAWFVIGNMWVFTSKVSSDDHTFSFLFRTCCFFA